MKKTRSTEGKPAEIAKEVVTVEATFLGYRPEALEVEGGTLRYIDEGAGPPVLLVHGTPTWSYLWRHFVPELARDHRVVAVDNLGFGRSDKAPGADYRPAAQASRLATLIDHLGLRDFVLVVHDFGGPIGLSYAVQHPGRVRGLVLFNTWMWSLQGTPTERVARWFSGRLGRFLYERLAFSSRVLLKAGFGDKGKLSAGTHDAYKEPFSDPNSRHATWVYARELLGSSAWYESLWSRRPVLRDIPTLLLWGMRDPAFGPADLARWQEALPTATTVRFPDAGHFVQEEEPGEARARLRTFVDGLGA